MPNITADLSFTRRVSLTITAHANVWSHDLSRSDTSVTFSGSQVTTETLRRLSHGQER